MEFKRSLLLRGKNCWSRIFTGGGGDIFQNYDVVILGVREQERKAVRAREGHGAGSQNNNLLSM